MVHDEALGTNYPVSDKDYKVDFPHAQLLISIQSGSWQIRQDPGYSGLINTSKGQEGCSTGWSRCMGEDGLSDCLSSHLGGGRRQVESRVNTTHHR